VGPGPPPSAVRRAELGDFLRTRRAARSPADAGLPVHGTRRTPGLRREEVAQLSGVGVSWYTWLEQGRDVTPSDQVLSALSRALALTAAERSHLFQLAGVAHPAGQDGPVDQGIVTLVDSLRPHIAFVLDQRFDVVAHNAAAEIVMGDLLARPPDRRNLLLWLFDGGTDWSEAGPAWERTARANLLDFRTEYARHAGEPAYDSLVARLLDRSETLRTWWAQHEVEAPAPMHKQIPHRTLGLLHLLEAQSRPAHQPSLRLRILTPADDRTRRVLAAAQTPPA
jgi:transcriptional regulator with XRE-family HTH domain